MNEGAPRILVIGAGAAGSALAALLHRAGAQVSLLARGNRLARLCEQGLHFADSTGTRSVPVPAVSWDAIAEPPDLALLAVKTCDLDGALAQAACRPLLRDAAFVTLQNGIDAPDQVCRALPQARVIAARMHGFVEYDGDMLRHVGVPISLAFAAWRPEPGQTQACESVLSQFHAVLEAAGIGASREDRIEAALWTKFMLAASLGGTAAALGVPAGQVLSSAEGAALLRGAMEEIARLAQRSGIALPADCAEQTLRFIAGFPAEATTSLQRDLEAGNRSEYAALVGAALRLGRDLEEPLRAFPAIDAMVRARGITPIG
ncbi:MAG TPA: 2-dehydropantoate 2-reductase [Novosphingobium sp.]|nr:2-dehydropantoate 2-reductase [Novosphingobium sp.]HQA17639.1 2-dehydropantoate 2-reductase [Novosphingobium sp.]